MRAIGDRTATVILGLVCIIGLLPFGAAESRAFDVSWQREQTAAAAATMTVRPVPPSVTPSPRPMTATPTATPTATATIDPAWAWAFEHAPVPWQVNCDDDIAWNGYRDEALGGYCIPGLLTPRALRAGLPADYYGALSSYAPGVMERIEARRGVPPGSGVATMDCTQIGYVLWLRVPNHHTDWQGPFYVVDCSAPGHAFYHHAVMGLAVEIGATKAAEWGITAARRVDVHVGSAPPGPSWNGVYLAGWWMRMRLAWETGWTFAVGVAPAHKTQEAAP